MMPRLAIFPEAPAPVLILAASLLTAREEFNGSTGNHRMANRDCAAATRAVERSKGECPWEAASRPWSQCRTMRKPINLNNLSKF